MRIEQEYLTLPRGSDVFFEFSCTDDNDLPIDMTGWNISLFEAGPDVSASAYVTTNHTVAWSDQSQGAFEFRLPWGVGVPGTFWIRLRLSRVSDGHDDGIDQINVRYT